MTFPDRRSYSVPVRLNLNQILKLLPADHMLPYLIYKDLGTWLLWRKIEWRVNVLLVLVLTNLSQIWWSGLCIVLGALTMHHDSQYIDL